MADHQFEEWQECRATIGRFDTILADLRKLGFSFVTGLMTAGAILAGTVDKLRPGAWTPVFGALMLLTLGLFVVDRYYQVLQWAAVKRARAIENPQNGVDLTTQISATASQAGTDFYVAIIYAAFIIGAFFLATVVVPDWASLGPVGGVGLVCLVAGAFQYYLTRKTAG